MGRGASVKGRGVGENRGEKEREGEKMAKEKWEDGRNMKNWGGERG